MDDLISIIIPVYNVSLYLEKCLDSVINQTYKNIEIIIVNDGSTDNSDKILEKYQKLDKRIKLIHQKNKGLSGARNTALKASSGKYISFIDSDDFVDNDFIEYLYKLIKNNNCDIASCSFNQNGKEKIQIYNQKEAMKELVNFNGNVFINVINKLYKKEIIDNILFSENHIYEDIEFNTSVFLKVNNMISSNLGKYHYLVRSDSISRQKFTNKEYDRVNYSYYLYKNFSNIYYDLNYYFKFYYYTNYLGYLNKQLISNKTNKEEFNKLRKKLKKDLFNLLKEKYSLRRKLQFIVFVININLYSKLYLRIINKK